MNSPDPTQNSLEFSDVIAIGWRHKGKFLLTFVPILSAMLALALLLPPVYQSSSTLLVEAQDIPEATVVSTVGGYVEARLAAIEKRILSTEVLGPIAQDVGLVETNAAPEDLSSALFQMRERISREATVIEAPNPRGPASTISFTVAYEDSDPARAQTVTETLATLYVNENTRQRVAVAEGVSDFLEEEAQQLQAELTTIEGEIARFKEQNFGSLPENQGGLLDDLERMEREQTSLGIRLQQLEERRFDLETQLRLNRGAGSRSLVQQALNEKRAALAQLKLQFQDAHPDVRALNAEIQGLEQALRTGNLSDAQAQGLISSDISISDSNQELALKARLDRTNEDIVFVQEQRAELQRRMPEIRERLSRSPEVEQRYAGLIRDYENAQDRFREIREQQMTSRLGLRLEQDERAERFVVIEPATFPVSPLKPNRPALVLLGLILAIAISVIVVVIAERFSTVIHGAKALAAITREQPLASIPKISA